jgi:hypothetical protein
MPPSRVDSLKELQVNGLVFHRPLENGRFVPTEERPPYVQWPEPTLRQLTDHMLISMVRGMRLPVPHWLNLKHLRY